MCLYYNMEMHTTDFVHDSAMMSLACFGEIASGMFVLFLPVLPRFFTYLRERKPSLSHRRAPSKLEFSDIGIKNGGPEKNDRSLWHISWTQPATEVGHTGGNREGQKVCRERKASKDFLEGKSFGSESYLSSVYSRDELDA